MKVLVVLLAVLALVWLLGGARRRQQGASAAARTKAAASSTPTPAMALCVRCGVYLPRDEALPGRGGVFCSEAHRAAHEQAARAS